MEPSPNSAESQKETPKVMYDNGHDNKVFVGDRLPQPQFTQPQSNGTTNPYYPNGNTHTNVNHSNENGQQQQQQQPSYRVIENSRL